MLRNIGDGQKLEIYDIEKRGNVLYQCMKTKVPLSCKMTMQRICILAFTYAKSRFSDVAAPIIVYRSGEQTLSGSKHILLQVVPLEYRFFFLF